MKTLRNSIPAAVLMLAFVCGITFNSSESHASTVCGVLEHVSGGPRETQKWRGIGRGWVTVNISAPNGKIKTRSTIYVVPGHNYEFKPKNGEVVGVSCGKR